MKKVIWLVFLSLCIPVFAFGQDTAARFVSSHKLGHDNGHLFLYRCNDTDNVFEIHQRYNPSSRLEEVRFIVNNLPEQWLAGGMSREMFQSQIAQACQETKIQRIATWYTH